MIEASLPLASDEVRVYYAWTEALERDDLAAQCLKLLSDDECVRHARFHFAEDRRSYLAAHALTRSVLAGLLDVAPRELGFALGEHGKPELIASSKGAPAIRFNLSHTRGLVACAVALDRAVGVDVERIDRRVDIDQLSRSVFSETERAELLQFADEDKRQRFFQLWTLKEAYIKAVGRGLSLPLRSISVQFSSASISGPLPPAPISGPLPPASISGPLPPAPISGPLPPAWRPRLAFAEPIADDGDEWWLAVHGLPPSHVLSVALHAVEPVQATTRVWAWPLPAL